ncbi:MAG: RrF2 family transcriptional regulator [Actinomycetota bacterium]
MHVSARVDYGMRALMELTSVAFEDPHRLVTSDTVARDQEIPPKFLENILRSLRRAGIVASQRGADGGFRLDRPPAEVSVADVIRALDGPLVAVRGEAPEDVAYRGNAEHLRDVWIATRAAIREVLEHVSLADIATGDLPSGVGTLLETPGAWKRRDSST